MFRSYVTSRFVIKVVSSLVAGIFLCLPIGCNIEKLPPLITVYSPALKVSFPLPQGWTADEVRSQAGFYMQTFTGRSVDVTDRPGIRVQVLGGPMPDNGIQSTAERFQRDLLIVGEEPHDLGGQVGRLWRYVSEDGEESSQLLLADVHGMLYGLFVRGETRTLEAYQKALSRMFADFSLEQSNFFESYEAASTGVVVRHPRSWKRVHFAGQSGESLFVGFRSTPLAVDNEGATIHATLEVTVNKVSPSTTVESFYVSRMEQLGDSYRLLRHEALPKVGAVSTLYYLETQLADYLERTIYFVNDGKSFIYKFNARNRVYRAIEPWIDDIVLSLFETSGVSSLE